MYLTAYHRNKPGAISHEKYLIAFCLRFGVKVEIKYKTKAARLPGAAYCSLVF